MEDGENGPADGVITSLPVLVSFLAEDGMVPKLKPSGLSGPEPWGTWSAAKVASLQFTFADPPPPSATITLSYDLSGQILTKDTLTIEVPDAASPKSLGISRVLCAEEPRG